MDSYERFTGLAEVYDRSRPDYPIALLDFLASDCGLSPGATIVDVGAGTGISSRWLAQRPWHVIAIEPNEDMRRRAQSMVTAQPIDYRSGTGEATGLPDACADAVLCAQAFHWLQPDPALREFARILKPAGWALVVFNERDPADPFTAAFGDIIRAHPESAQCEDARQASAAAFLASPRFVARERLFFHHQQTLDEETVIGRALSMSHAPRDPAPRAALIAALQACFARWQTGGTVTMRYQTSLCRGRKAASGE